MEYICCNDKLNLSVEEYFPDAVDRYLEGYIVYLERRNVDPSIITNIKEFYRNIHTCLSEYYFGQHGSARDFFNAAMEYVDIGALCSPLREENFYRARSVSEDELDPSDVLSKEELFHIPLEKRHLVSTERYSFPGLPCLYLGSSYEVCCEELEDWNDDLFIAKIKKRNNVNINILDLSFFDRYDIHNMDVKLMERMYSLWPIIACCSFSYNMNKEMKFRPDYIIPQLLLEYIIDTNYDKKILGIEEDIVGIRYRTVRKTFYNLQENRFDNKYVNYVFPVLSNEQCGHCSKLKDFFDVTEVFRLKELMSNGRAGV
ncbi:hypothetical protein ACQRBN_04580 [Bariatricus sp. SGI.154]|uniref:hypothetical protein n=1 Tax=Bariatricus sp. SGI.154 TaxID=3420549 RepID=UPI003D05EBB6